MSEGKRISVLLIAIAAIVAAIPSYRDSKVQAERGSQSLEKMSPELIHRLRRGEGPNRAAVIVQFNVAPASALDSLINSVGGRITRRLNKLNMNVIDLPLNAVEALAARNEVRFISPDQALLATGHVETTTGTAAVRTQSTTTLLGLITNTTVFDGHGIGIAVVDSGIDVRHVSFRNDLGISRVVASQDFTGENRTDDPYGHGTHVASIAGGNNQVSSGAYTGIAPAVNLINLRILDSQGAGSTSSLLAALDWVMTYRAVYNIRIVNMSVGTPAIDSYLNDPVCLAVRRASDAGITVVAAAGNNGKTPSGEKIYGQIHSPGNEPSAITVGAANTFGTDARNDDVVTTYSSRGPTRSFWTDANGLNHYDNFLKPDLVAPGNRIIGAAASNNLLLATHPELDANVSSLATRRMMYLSGSSMAAPVAAGAVALMLQANPNLTPSLIKAILMYTAQPLSGLNTLEQGSGEINVDGALRIAELVRNDLGTSTSLGAPLLTSSAPAPQTSIAGHTFPWSGGIILNHTYATGSELITAYQKVYGNGQLLGEGVTEAAFAQSVNPLRMMDTILLGSALKTSDGTGLGQGASFLDLSFLLGDGFALTDGLVIADGVLVGDGVMVGDGVLVGDSSVTSINGDSTSCMR